MFLGVLFSLYCWLNCIWLLYLFIVYDIYLFCALGWIVVTWLLFVLYLTYVFLTVWLVCILEFLVCTWFNLFCCLFGFLVEVCVFSRKFFVGWGVARFLWVCHRRVLLLIVCNVMCWLVIVLCVFACCKLWFVALWAGLDCCFGVGCGFVLVCFVGAGAFTAADCGLSTGVYVFVAFRLGLFEFAFVLVFTVGLFCVRVIAVRFGCLLLCLVGLMMYLVGYCG